MCDGITEAQKTEERIIWKIVEWHRCVYLDFGVCVYYLEITTMKDLESIIGIKLSCDELRCYLKHQHRETVDIAFESWADCTFDRE